MPTTQKKISALSPVLLGGLILAMAALLRCVNLSRGLWYDEFSSLELASASDFLLASRAYDHPPLYFFILRFWLKLGDSIEWLRLLSVIFSTASIYFGMRWLRELDSHATLPGGLLLATSPGLLSFSQEVRHYSFLVLLVTILLWSLERWLKTEKSGGWLLPLFSITLTLAICTHLISLFLLPGLVVYGYLRLKRKEKLKALLLASLLPLLTFVGLYSWYLRGANHTYENGWWIPPPNIYVLGSNIAELLGFPQMLEGLMVLPSDLLQFAVILFFVGMGVLVWCLAGGKSKMSAQVLTIFIVSYAAIVIYSYCFISVLVSRTVLFLILPLLASLTLLMTGITIRWQRYLALLILLSFSSLGAARWVFWESANERVPWTELTSVLDQELSQQPTVDPNSLIISAYPPDAEVMLNYKTTGKLKPLILNSKQLLENIAVRPSVTSVYYIWHERSSMPAFVFKEHMQIQSVFEGAGFAGTPMLAEGAAELTTNKNMPYYFQGEVLFSKKGLTLYRYRRKVS